MAEVGQRRRRNHQSGTFLAFHVVANGNRMGYAIRHNSWFDGETCNAAHGKRQTYNEGLIQSTSDSSAQKQNLTHDLKLSKQRLVKWG